MPVQPFGVCPNRSVPFSANEAALDVVRVIYRCFCLHFQHFLTFLHVEVYMLFFEGGKTVGHLIRNQPKPVSTFTKAMHTSSHSIILHQVYKVVIDPAYKQALACC